MPRFSSNSIMPEKTAYARHGDDTKKLVKPGSFSGKKVRFSVETDGLKLDQAKHCETVFGQNNSKPISERKVAIDAKNLSFVKEKFYKLLSKMQLINLLSPETREKIYSELDSTDFCKALSKQEALCGRSNTMYKEVLLENCNKVLSDKDKEPPLSGKKIEAVEVLKKNLDEDSLSKKSKKGDRDQDEIAQLLHERYALISKAKRMGVQELFDAYKLFDAIQESEDKKKPEIFLKLRNTLRPDSEPETLRISPANSRLMRRMNDALKERLVFTPFDLEEGMGVDDLKLCLNEDDQFRSIFENHAKEALECVKNGLPKPHLGRDDYNAKVNTKINVLEDSNLVSVNLETLLSPKESAKKSAPTASNILVKSRFAIPLASNKKILMPCLSNMILRESKLSMGDKLDLNAKAFLENHQRGQYRIYTTSTTKVQ